MKSFRQAITPQLVAARFQARLELRKPVVLNNVSDLAEANESSVCFFENDAYLADAKQSQAGLIFVKLDFDTSLLEQTNLLFVEKPYLAFMMFVRGWMEIEEQQFESSIDASAKIAPSAVLPLEVRIGPNVVIGEHVKIGDRCVLEANCVLREHSVLGQNCHLFPNVTVYENSRIGDRVILHAGVVIGADGFGYLLHEGRQEKIPQLGNVIIEDDVEIGANSCIDRATLGTTVIGQGTKIDNLVQVGHNVHIGSSSILCSQVGIAGSSEVGDVVYLAGQVGVGDHCKIENGVMVGAQSGVAGKIPANSKIFGTPAIDANLRKRIVVVEKHLPEIWRFVNKQMTDEKE